MISALISRLIILSFGTLYPAYASYKAVRTKSVKEYVKWMMYWIVYAFFTCFETVTDIFFSWFPFYYEIKVIIVLWLLSPATKGSSTLYRKFVHPALARHEQNIDEYLNQAKERGYTAVVQLGAKGVNYATNLVVQTAIKTLHYGFRGVAVNVQPQQQLPGYVMSSLSSSSTNFIDSNTNTNDDHNSGDNYDMTDFMFVSRRPEAFVEFSDEDDEFNLILHPPHPVLPRQQQQQTVSHTNLLENHSYNDNNERDNYGNYNTNEGVRSADDNDVDVDDGATIVGGSDGRVILTRKAKEKSRNNRVSKSQNPSAAADYPAAGRRTRGRRKLRHIDVFANEYDMDVDVEH